MLQYLSAPLFKNKILDAGTKGADVSWTLSNGTKSSKLPEVVKFQEIAAVQASQGLMVNFTALQEWFVPRYTAWKADASAGVTLDETFAAFAGMWVPSAALKGNCNATSEYQGPTQVPTNNAGTCKAPVMFTLSVVDEPAIF